MYKYKHTHTHTRECVYPITFLPDAVVSHNPQEDQQRKKWETDKHSEPESFSMNKEMLYTYNTQKRASTNINMCQEFEMPECFSSHNSCSCHTALMEFEDE